MAQMDGKQLKNGTVSSAKVDTSVLVTDAARTLNATLTVGTGDIVGLPATPSGPTAAVSKAYADAVAQGLQPKASVAAVSAVALPAYTRVVNVITANANGAFPTVDGVVMDIVYKKRLVLKDGAAGQDNGIYDLTDAGSGGTPWVLTRSADADNSPAGEVTSGMYCFAVAGTLNGLKGWVLVTPDPITLNVTSLSFSQLSQVAASAWGGITGTLSNQTDLQNALNAKVTGNVAITGATNTKITYDSKGLVTAGSAATTADIADSTNARYVTDAQLVVIGNTSGTNSGDQSLRSDMRGLSASVTTADYDQAMTTVVSANNTHGGEVAVFVNGQKQFVGDGTRAAECYFGATAATARAFSAIVATDKLYWVGSVALFQLSATDKIDVMFMP